MHSAASFISRPSISLPRYSGVRPIIRPQMKTARMAYMVIFISPTPLPPNTTFNIIWSMGTIPPRGRQGIMHIIDGSGGKGSSRVVNIADCATPKRTSFPSMLPID